MRRDGFPSSISSFLSTSSLVVNTIEKNDMMESMVMKMISSENGEKYVRKSESETEKEEFLLQEAKHLYYNARRIQIHEFSRANTGVWYFHVETSMTTLPPYSVPRRYTEFVQLHDKIKRVVSQEEKIPTLPMKEYITSMSSFGGLWRRNTAAMLEMLEKRREKFQLFLQWIENHPIARNACAFQEFIGQPPSTTNGYVSLKEYTPTNFLSSLSQISKEKERKKKLLRASCSSSTSSNGSMGKIPVSDGIASTHNTSINTGNTSKCGKKQQVFCEFNEQKNNNTGGVPVTHYASRLKSKKRRLSTVTCTGRILVDGGGSTVESSSSTGNGNVHPMTTRSKRRRLEQASDAQGQPHQLQMYHEYQGCLIA